MTAIINQVGDNHAIGPNTLKAGSIFCLMIGLDQVRFFILLTIICTLVWQVYVPLVINPIAKLLKMLLCWKDNVNPSNHRTSAISVICNFDF